MGGIAAELAEAGVPKLVGVSHDAPPVLERWRKELDLGYELLSDLNWEGARAFGVLRDEVFKARPWNTRGAFVVDPEGVLRWGWVAPEPSRLPKPGDVLAAVRALGL